MDEHPNRRVDTQRARSTAVTYLTKAGAPGLANDIGTLGGYLLDARAPGAVHEAFERLAESAIHMVEEARKKSDERRERFVLAALTGGGTAAQAIERADEAMAEFDEPGKLERLDKRAANSRSIIKAYARALRTVTGWAAHSVVSTLSGDAQPSPAAWRFPGVLLLAADAVQERALAWEGKSMRLEMGGERDLEWSRAVASALRMVERELRAEAEHRAAPAARDAGSVPV